MSAGCRDHLRNSKLSAPPGHDDQQSVGTGYVKNCGQYSAPVLPLTAGDAAPAVPGASEAAAETDDSERPPALQRHRLLDNGFRLQSKAFMLTFHSRGLTDKTWPLFRAWVLERRAALGARRWAACLEESMGAAAAVGSDGAVCGKVFHLHAYQVVVVVQTISQ